MQNRVGFFHSWFNTGKQGKCYDTFAFCLLRQSPKPLIKRKISFCGYALFSKVLFICREQKAKLERKIQPEDVVLLKKVRSHRNQFYVQRGLGTLSPTSSFAMWHATCPACQYCMLFSQCETIHHPMIVASIIYVTS